MDPKCQNSIEHVGKMHLNCVFIWQTDCKISRKIFVKRMAVLLEPATSLYQRRGSTAKFENEKDLKRWGL